MRADEVMQRDPITIVSSMSFLDIQNLFVTARIGGAPVVDERGAVMGMIDTFDLLRAVDQALDDEIDPGETGDGFEDRLAELSATDVMSPQIVWVQVDTPVTEIARSMRAEAVHRALVGDNGRLVGIVSSFDLLPAIR